jgi:hypothetical protein
MMTQEEIEKGYERALKLAKFHKLTPVQTRELCGLYTHPYVIVAHKDVGFHKTLMALVDKGLALVGEETLPNHTRFVRV